MPVLLFGVEEENTHLNLDLDFSSLLIANCKYTNNFERFGHCYGSRIGHFGVHKNAGYSVLFSTDTDIYNNKNATNRHSRGRFAP